MSRSLWVILSGGAVAAAVFMWQRRARVGAPAEHLTGVCGNTRTPVNRGGAIPH